jgi:hypothetical protein
MISQVRLFAASSPAEQFPRHSSAHERAGVLLREKNEFADFHNPDSVGAETLCKFAGAQIAKKLS